MTYVSTTTVLKLTVLREMHVRLLSIWSPVSYTHLTLPTKA